MSTTDISADNTNTIQITTDGPKPPCEIRIYFSQNAQHMTEDDASEGSEGDSGDDGYEDGLGYEDDLGGEDDHSTPDSGGKTSIDNVTITTQGPKPPANIKVTVTCDVQNTGGDTPKVYFPAQGTGTPMTNTSGNAWTVSDTQMYGRGEQNLTIMCNGAKVQKKFKA